MLMERCRVCDDPNASKHYGSFCCSGCKGFFRRTIKFKRIYRCQYSKNCTISQEYRNSCRACRFDKCLENGLDPNMVHDDRGIVNAKTFKAEMEAKVARHKKIKNEFQDSDPQPSSSISPPEKLESHLAVIEYHDTKLTFEKECQKWHDLVVESSKRMYQAASGPLGSIRIVPEFDKSNGFSIANYFVLVEKLCDEYFDCNAVHTISPSTEYSHSTNVCASRALSEPREISARTKIDWTGRFFITSFAFKRIWCRIVSLYMDWTSHIPELRELTIADQIRLVLDRCVPCIDLLIGYRTMQNNIKGIALSGGTYFPRDKAERDLIEDELKPYLTHFANWLYDEFTLPAKEMDLTSAEYALLRLLVFFVPVPGLSMQGKEIVRKANNFYREVLAQHIKSQYDSSSMDLVLNRMGEIMKFLSVIETAKNLEDEGFSVMTLFNIANMQGELPYEVHIRKGFST